MAENGSKDDIYSFKTDSPSDGGCKAARPLQKYKRKLPRQSSDDEEKVPAIKPCVVLLKRTKLCEDAWLEVRDSFEERQKIEAQVQQPQKELNGNSSGTTSPVLGDGEFRCAQCGDKFSGRNLYMHHMRNTHSNNNNNNNNSSSLHSARQQQQPTPPPAPMGGYPRFLAIKGVWKLDTRSLDCEFCCKPQPSPYKLKEHAEVEHGKTIVIRSPADSSGGECVNFPCTLCHKVCKTKLSLEKHMCVKHAGQTNNHERNPEREPIKDNAKCKVYECPYCFTLHANKDRFKKHLGFIQFNYSDCQVMTDNASMLRQKDPVTCEVCGSKAANLAFLHAHQSTHAELPRPNECPDGECRKKFVFPCQLNRHMLLHQVKSSPPPTPLSPGGQKGPKDRFRCHRCAKRTRTKAKMDQHIDSCHKPNMIEFRCQLCNISYGSIKQLTSHCAKKHEGMEVNIPSASATHNQEAVKEDECWPLPDATFTPFPASQVQPESIGSDSVSASDAFSMYFQSLHSLNPMDMDIPLDLEGNVSVTEKILNPLDCASPVQTGLSTPLQQVSPEFSGRKKESELQFHTLQTVQHPETSITFLQSLPGAPAVPIEETTAVQTELLVPSLDTTTFFPLEEKQVVSFTPAVQPVSLETQVLPIFPTPVLKYDPNLDLAIKQELEKNTKELQEICDSTSIGFIPVPESEVVAVAATAAVAAPAVATLAAPAVAAVASVPLVATVAVPQPEVVRLPPTPENLDKIVQQIMRPNEQAPSQPAPQPPPQLQPPPETVKQKLAAKTKKKKEEKPPPEALPEVAPPTGQEDCKLCHKVFASHELLIKHVQQNCAGKNQPGADTMCQLCGERLTDRKLYLKHKKEQHPESLLQCPACEKLFFLSQSLARHTKQTCTQRVNYTCRKCKQACESLEALRTHTQTQHPENVVCPICKKVLASSQSLKRHVKSHDKDAPLANSTSDSALMTLTSAAELDESCESSDSNLRRVSLNQPDNLDANDDLSFQELSSWGAAGADLINIENNLDEEMLLCGNRSDTACEFCGADFPSEQLLLAHLSSQHFPNTQWQPLARNLSAADDSAVAAAPVSCNDS